MIKQVRQTPTSYENAQIGCTLCINECKLNPGDVCRSSVRRNLNGKLVQLNYGQILGIYEVLGQNPNLKRASVALAGSNNTYKLDPDWGFSKLYQESRISLTKHDSLKILECSGSFFTPENLIDYLVSKGFKEVDFNIGEPLVNVEYLVDVARYAINAGVSTYVKTYGNLDRRYWADLTEIVDGISINLFSTHPTLYKKYFKIHSKDVLEFISYIDRRGKLVTLHIPVITDVNDSQNEMENHSRFAATLNSDLEVIFERVGPDYKILDLPATPDSVLEQAVTIAIEFGLKNVHRSN